MRCIIGMNMVVELREREMEERRVREREKGVERNKVKERKWGKMRRRGRSGWSCEGK